MTTTATAAPYASGPASRAVPGPKGSFVFGNLNDFRRDSLKLLSDSAQKFGDLYKLQLVQNVYILSGPSEVGRVLHENHTNYQKSFIYERMRPLLGNGLLTSNGDFWKRQRRLAQPAFHRQRIAGFGESMVRHTQRMLERWRTQAVRGEPIDVHAEMMRLTLVIVGEALFSVNLMEDAGDVGRALTAALEIINDRFTSFFIVPQAIPTPQNRRFAQAMKVLDGAVDRIIGERHASSEARHDLLAMLMEVRDEETGQGMTDAQLRDEVMTMVLAGHETTANALSWAWYLLSKHPHVEQKLRQELHQVIGERAPTLADLPNLRYATMVIEEAMRLYPPAWAFGRQAIQDDVIGGYLIPAGANVTVCTYTLHRNPRYWENPEGFEPERFLPERAASRPKMAYIPFAAGPRMCIGNQFAMMEMQIILSMVAQAYRLELVPGFRAEPDPSVTLRPIEGVKVTLRPQAPLA